MDTVFYYLCYIPWAGFTIGYLWLRFKNDPKDEDLRFQCLVIAFLALLTQHTISPKAHEKVFEQCGCVAPEED